MSTPKPIEAACAKSLENFERDYMPPRSSYALYTTHPKSKDEPKRSYKLDLHKPDTLSSGKLKECLDLVEKTSGRHYRDSRQGWSSKRKRSEMGLWDLRYLVIREVDHEEVEGEGQWEDVERGGDGEDVKGEEMEKETIVGKIEGKEGDGEIKGFMSFMPTFEDGIPVLYLYEIHLEDSLRGTGLGTHLMNLLTYIAHAIPIIKKIMLTCFTANESALGFYKKLGYEKDECSPEPRKLKGGKRVECDYVILSRKVQREGEEKAGEEDVEVGKRGEKGIGSECGSGSGSGSGSGTMGEIGKEVGKGGGKRKRGV